MKKLNAVWFEFENDRVPLKTRFCFAALMMKEQAQIIIDQRKNHKLADWEVICEQLKSCIGG